MNKKQLLILAVGALTSLSASADTNEELTINGQPVEKFVTQIAFEGDNVVLTFDDQSQQKEDMATVVINLSYGDADPTAVNSVKRAREEVETTLYNLAGQRINSNGSPLPKGIYIKNGTKLMIT